MLNTKNIYLAKFQQQLKLMLTPFVCLTNLLTYLVLAKYETTYFYSSFSYRFLLKQILLSKIYWKLTLLNLLRKWKLLAKSKRKIYMSLMLL